MLVGPGPWCSISRLIVCYWSICATSHGLKVGEFVEFLLGTLAC